MSDPTLVVQTISDSFASLWPTLATEVGLALDVRAATPKGVDPTGAIALIAAGGDESQLARACRELRADGEVTFAAIAADAGHRLTASVIHAGADQLFVLPEDLDLLRSWLKEGAERLLIREQRRTFAEGERRKYDFREILGGSAALGAALERAARAIPHAGVTVLVTGETGTGKELVARAIHYNGPRREGPFIDINCAALPEHLLESDLFGHEKGAFTDASAAKPGLFEMAQGGTIFLDEIGHLALPLQGKLLRALQERSIRRVGGVRAIPIDVRVIAATHVHLEQAVKAGQFREDLYYRLNVLPIALPPLRQRREDILPLARHFLARFSVEYGVANAAFSARAERALLARDWPGNVRELRNLIERTVLLANQPLIDEADFEFELQGAPADGAHGAQSERLSDIVYDAVVRAVEACGGNKSASARRLGISRTRLQRLLDRTGNGDDGDEGDDA